MKSFTFTCLVLLFSVLGNAGILAQTNLLSNPGFENGLDDDGYIKGWTPTPDPITYPTYASYTLLTSDYHSGSNCVELNHLYAAGGATIYQTLNASASTSYDFSLSYKVTSVWASGTSTTIKLRLIISFLLSDGVTVLSSQSNLLTYTLNEWQTCSFTFTAPEGTSYIKYSIIANKMTVNVDDASVAVSTTSDVNVLNESGQKLSVYPNPVGNTAQINFSEAGNNAELTLVSLSGQQVLQQQIEKGATHASIDVSSLAKGIYIVKYTDANGSQTTRLVK